jgi:hypothetical protein
VEGGGVNNARHMHGPEGVLIKSADTSQIALPVLVCGVRYVLYVQVTKEYTRVVQDMSSVFVPFQGVADLCRDISRLWVV